MWVEQRQRAEPPAQPEFEELRYNIRVELCASAAEQFAHGLVLGDRLLIGPIGIAAQESQTAKVFAAIRICVPARLPG